MPRIDVLFLRIAVLYALAGIALGIFMAMSEDHSQMPTHAHINLVGWTSMALYAVVYRLWPEAGMSPLARWHFWLANAGALLVVIGVAGIMEGHPERFEPIAGIGSIATLLAMLLFAGIVFRRVSAVRSPGLTEKAPLAATR
ncbi:MAG TPA: cytochrome-c oxidase [Stellaceae bacterium]|nr:cytochrome-c oxidase [Stellaceae bacterium]